MDINLAILEYQQRLNEFLIDPEPLSSKQHDLLRVQHVFKFIYKHFNKLNEAIQMSDVLPILHHSLRLELQTGNSIHVGAYINALLYLSDSGSNDRTLQSCLQILYQILETLSVEDMQYLQIGNEVFHKLIEILLANPSTSNKANILACLQLYVKKCKAVEIVTHLWTSIKSFDLTQITVNTALLQTLIHFYDEFSLHISEFKASTKFTHLVSRLLNSDHHENRKCAYFLLKKAHLAMEEQLTERVAVWKKQDLGRTKIFWKICIDNFESLEENQFHLILPSLEQLKKLHISDLTEKIWLNILYRQILRHKNISVRQWMLGYLIENHTYFSMTSETQTQFMRALNDTNLYNVNGYMPPAVDIGKFLQCNRSNFLRELSEIDWEAVPLHFWLAQLHLHWKTVNVEDISEEVLMKLASKIDALQNTNLNPQNIELFRKLFSRIIDSMELTKYVQLVEALYCLHCFEYVHELVIKVEKCEENGLDGDIIFTPWFYHILSRRRYLNEEDYLPLVKAIEEKIQGNNWKPGLLLLLMILHSDADTIRKIVKDCYGTSLLSIQRETPLNAIYENFYRQFARTDQERYLVKQAVTDCYVLKCIEKYGDLETLKLNVEELINDGSFGTLCHLTRTLKYHRKFIGVHKMKYFAEKLLEGMEPPFVRYADPCGYLVRHCKYSGNKADLVINQVGGASFPDNFLINGALPAKIDVLDSRIEVTYQCQTFQWVSYSYFNLYKYSNLITQLRDKERKTNILKTLCEKIRDINSKAPGYYENSEEHRSIVHILYVILDLLPNTSVNSERTSEFWEFLLENNNQPNVAILYQIIIATTTSWEEAFSKITKKLKVSTCTSSQEVSMIAILYRCYKSKCKFENATQFENLILLLWPLTMGEHCETRLYAQLVIWTLLDECEMKNPSLSEPFLKLGATLKKTLTHAQFTKFKEDIRFMDVNINEAYGRVMHFTNSPCYEYDFSKNRHIETTRKELAERNPKEPQTNDSIVDHLGMQKELDIVADFLPLPDLYSYPDFKENVLYVVASLIDDVSYLNEIARACKVLGIRNLVISFKAHIPKDAYKSLSMTAQRNVAIEEIEPAALTEFILHKKTEGFKIIGVEQTANSCSLVNFNFPKRSVLLLGHEKVGILPNLLGFLDYAVEMPQFVMMRSSNMYETGTILMWEYCKQHIVKS